MQFLPVCLNMCFGMILKTPKPFEEDSLGLKQSSYQPDGDELRMLPAGKSTGQHLFMGETENANMWHMWGKQDGKHPSDWAPKAVNNGIAIGPSYSTLVLAKWSIAKCSTNSWPLHGQFVLLLPMQGSNWPVFEMFRILGTCLSHRARITAMHVCDSRFDKHWHGAKSSRSFFNASCAMRCKNGVPRILPSLQEVDLTFGVKAESDMA